MLKDMVVDLIKTIFNHIELNADDEIEARRKKHGNKLRKKHRKYNR